MKVLQFSGGIDSLACLLLLKDEPGLVVATVLTDGAYPSTSAYLDRVMAAFPSIRFVVKHTTRDMKVYGHPVDVVPLRWTAMGQLVRGGTDTRYQDSFSCCRRSIWEPLDWLSRELGATEIYRGQRNNDRLRSPAKDGDRWLGVTLRFPLADWSREQVMDYVMAQAPELLPPGYDQGEKTSRDCWDCTAYLCDNQRRIANLPPAQFRRVNDLLDRWRRDVATEMEA